MQSYNVILTWEAIYDITDIAEYIEAEFGKERADCFQDDIRKQMKDLEIMGSFLCKTSLLFYDYFIYKKLFLPSIIFYIIKEPEKEIHVLRVLREESNWQKILSKQSNYTYPTNVD